MRTQSVFPSFIPVQKLEIKLGKDGHVSVFPPKLTETERRCPHHIENSTPSSHHIPYGVKYFIDMFKALSIELVAALGSMAYEILFYFVPIVRYFLL